MFSILTLAAYFFIFLASIPTALLLCRDQLNRAPVGLLLAIAVALTAGILSLVMLWMGLLSIPYTAPAIFFLTIFLLLPGLYICWKQRPQVQWSFPHGWQLFALCLLMAIAAVILIDSALWPFFRDDAIAIYQPQALQIYTTGSLIPLQGQNTLYEAYPMLIQMNYGYVYLLSGWENDYLAKLIPAILAVACLPVVFHLGKRANGDNAGWVAALLLALMPTFGSWATAGYTDLPMALFLTLGALFSLRLWDNGSKTDALALGIMLGLAAWTKNNALIAIPAFGLWLLLALWQRRISWTHIVITATAGLFVAAPWYIRNIVNAGMLISPTAWTDQAERTATSLLIFLTLFGTYGLSGWLIVLGVIDGSITVVRQRWKAAPQLLLLLISIPFFAGWWLFASYDERFLLAILPMLCVLAGVFVMHLWRWLPENIRPVARWAAALGALAFTVFILWNTLEYKDNLLRQPFMTDAERRTTVGREVTQP